MELITKHAPFIGRAMMACGLLERFKVLLAGLSRRAGQLPIHARTSSRIQPYDALVHALLSSVRDGACVVDAGARSAAECTQLARTTYPTHSTDDKKNQDKSSRVYWIRRFILIFVCRGRPALGALRLPALPPNLPRPRSPPQRLAARQCAFPSTCSSAQAC
jgi:hypothetical protein